MLTGGGSAGHVVPHLALLPALKKRFDKIYYIGSLSGIEKDIIGKHPEIVYYGVTTVKLRRKFTLKNLAIPFKSIKGRREAETILRQLKPDIVFSKGGFVAVPVVSAAAKLKIPVVAHESDITPGLANKLTAKKCKKICTTFPAAAKLLGEKAVYTGAPIRPELYKAAASAKGYDFTGEKPVLLVMGGSLGAKAVNAALRENLRLFTNAYDVLHICGKGNLLSANIPEKSLVLKPERLPDKNNVFGARKPLQYIPPPAAESGGKPNLPANYIQIEYTDDIAPLFAAADIVISRAGSGAIHELLALKKPMLLIPLPKTESRGDQLLNADDFKRRGIARVLLQEEMTSKSLKAAADKLYEERLILAANMQKEKNADGTANIMHVILECAGISDKSRDTP